MTQKRGYSATLARLEKTGKGRKALSLFRRFWGVTTPTAIVTRTVPGPKRKVRVMVGLGKCPAITLSDGPRGRAKKQRRVTLNGHLACDPSGRHMMIYGGPKFKRKFKRGFLGFVASTEYIPTRAIENAGSFKARKWWKHEHSDEGGSWPKAHLTNDGNIVYSKGTYTVGKWIRR